jgi:PncC family amidohydrolase
MYLHKKIIKKLLKRNISISVVESCTGGLLSSSFTSVAGISKIFNMGLITYSNKSKSSLLKISQNDLKKYGAVSHQTAALMVKNLQKLTKSRLCISTTGIAGPTGGTKVKPVGLIFFGINYRNKTIVSEKKFKGSRIQIQQKTVKAVFIEIAKLI